MTSKLSATEYRLIVEHSPVMIWRSGLDAKCDYFNEPWLAFTGRTLEQEAGDGWAEGVHQDDLERCVSHYLDHFHRRAPFEMEYRLRRHDGVYRWIFDRGVPFADDRGAFAGYIGSCIDIDEAHKAREAERRRNVEQLAAARDFEKWILAIVSHDIRNPLAAIHSAAQHLRLLGDGSPQLAQHAVVVSRSASRIQHLVSELLDQAREREGMGIPIAPSSVDLGTICRHAVDELLAAAPDREIGFECEADGLGEWDAHRVLQAVSNLIGNGVQHGAPGTPVRVRLTGDADRVVVEVESRGVIPDDMRPLLFEPFHSRRHSEKAEGLGLGLFIARAIAQAHGGHLAFESSGGHTRFRLVLPRRTAGSRRANGL
ncbi:MAG: PAS domain-containing sensor histidine kinase [Betaproteobacteria bacterium]|nr:PAS domain-containing sensor histidine kinase [Betaproteobacteria bacterium]